MRVLHILEALEGGTALHVRTLVEHQCAAGYEVGLVIPRRRVWGATDESLAELMRGLGQPLFEVPMHRNPLHPTNVAAAARVARIVRRWRPTVVHTHSSVAGAIGRPVARGLGVPTVYTPNGVYFSDPARTRQATAARVLERTMAPFTSMAIAASASEGDVLATVYRRDKVAVIANGIPVGPPPPPLPERFRVVAVSRFVYQKHPEQIVRVLAALRRQRPDAEAVMVGYGELEPEVTRLIAELDPGIEVSRQPGPDAMAGASALLLASRWEGAPYVVLEAMNLGRAVVASDVVGSRDTVVHGETGFLFPPDDAEAGGAYLAALAGDPGKTAAMGRAGRQRLETSYDIATMGDAVADVYARITR